MINTIRNSIKILIIALILLAHVFALEYRILEEDETGLRLHIEDHSDFQWIGMEDYPEYPGYFSLGEAGIFPVSNALSIPYWSFPLGFPSPDKPAIQISNPIYEKINLDRDLLSEDIDQINNQTLADVVDIGYLRFSPAGDLIVIPIKCIDKYRISVLRSVDIRIRYSKVSEKYEEPTIRSRPNQLTDLTFINKKSAGKWQKKPPHQLAKTPPVPSGKWIKLTITEDSIYEINYNQLKESGLNEQNIDVNRIFLFSNSTGGREINDTPGIPVSDNLIENTRLIVGDQDGVLNDGDKILFYGRSTSGIDAGSSGKLDFHRNAYSLNNYYWLLIADIASMPKSMPTVISSSNSPDIIVTKFEKIQRHEVESVNFLRSGKYWYGERFNGSGSNVSVIFQLPQPTDEDPPGYLHPAELELATCGISNDNINHTFSLNVNNISTQSWSTRDNFIANKKINLDLKSGLNIIKINYTSSISAGQAALDYMQIRYECPLQPNGNSMDFWGPAYSGLIEYQLSDISFTDPVIYDISDWRNVSIQSYSGQSMDKITFRATNDITKRSHYLITNPSFYKSPKNIELLNNPQWNTLRKEDIGAQYVIITVEEFRDAADDLARLYNEDVRESDRLSTIVVYQDQILREFNASIVDPHAIRQFLTYAFQNWTIPPEYVLLLGDGTFDYRHIESETGDIVMTYQVEPASQSGNGFNSYSTDARFVYVHGNDKKMDMAIGRINARTAEEAQTVVDKIRDYTLSPIYGEWRSTVTLVADDPERPRTGEVDHINQSENLVYAYLPASIGVKKVYLLEYPEVQDAATYGVKKPDATADLFKQLEKGTTIINYFGHGSSTVWAQEYILEMERDIDRINTGMKLPFWIAATCSWGQCDDINSMCMPEALLLQPKDGGIAGLAATRATYSSSNGAFVNNLITKLFNPNGVNRIRLGKLLQIISAAGLNENNEKYVLFGDPALYLALPYGDAKFDPLESDTLKTLSNITVNGSVSGANTSQFFGTGIVKLYDSERYVTRYYTNRNKETKSMSYLLPGEVLFKGQVEINAGQFSSRFFVPKDINYANHSGRISVYGWDPETGEEIGGYYKPLYFAGSESVFDTTGPKVDLGFTGIDFRDGDIVTPKSQFEITISDPRGINIAGKMGHDIVLMLDNDLSNSYKLTEYFSYDTNSDTSGKIIWPIPELSPGKHSVTVTAWDNGNNSTTTECDFNLLTSEGFQLIKVVNFPNPFKGTTDITFNITAAARIECSIYTVRGLRIKMISSEDLQMPGFNTIHWNGKDDFGDTVAKGIYIYKIKAVSIESGQKDHYIGKMVKVG